MSSQVYVGNFPFSFTNDDLLNLFQDYKGIELRKTNNVNNKCFAFLQCLDQDQVVDIVTTMHDIDVCGRNLIVRAVDKELQSLIFESLRENNVLGKQTRNILHSHSNVNKSSNRFIGKKNFMPSSIDKVSEFPTGVRFRNPLLQSSDVEKKNDYDSQRRSDSPSDAYNCKTSNQSKYAHEIQPCYPKLSTYDPGLYKRNDSSQKSNKLDVKTQNASDEGAGIQNFGNNTSGRHTRFINPCLQSSHAEKKNDYDSQRRSDSPSNAYNCKTSNQSKYAYESQPCYPKLNTYGPELSKCNASSHTSNKSDVNSQNFPDKGAGRQYSMNNTTLRNTQFFNPCLQSPGNQSDYAAHHSPDSHLSNHQYIKPPQKVCDFQTKPSQHNSFNHGNEERKYNGSSQSAQASDTRTQSLFAEGASGHEDKQHYNKSSCTGKYNAADHGTERNSHNAKEMNISHPNIDDFSYSRDDCNIAIDNEEAGTCQSPFFDESINKKEMYYASVANFPFQTTIADLYDLMQDLDPYNIIMICNVPLRDRRPTEAIVCFETEDQVTDAILNFDNTIYFGRSLVVSDATDLSILPELLSLNLKNL